ncbi:anti-sigma-K factor RskA [Nitritalea halalkaliphila LW7]|uniref:Anti-sigma-K factor RskA n=1 Tax=Nitritalea halalkaliphila LW7 TaxID=1189621 RepID=I5C0N1_9BACT|nr:anti-sigma factor [Nitritalea halalkaliphila]EIM75383.1 anti-sigma-K factor RskA [Nitritalea halalkaliphila LW7]
MDIQAYISSGKLELYVLGELSEREREEVVRLAKRYPEIKEELVQIELAMEAFDQKAAVKPSLSVKNRIFDTLDAVEKEEKSQGTKAKQVIPPTMEMPQAAPVSAETPVVKLQPWKAYAAAASLVAVVASVFAIYFATQYYDVENRFTALLQEQSVLAESAEQYKVNFEETSTQLETLLAGNFSRIPMKGEPFEIQKEAQVDVWWDAEREQVFISVNQLAALDAEQDYQLWAIGDDGPVGIGLVNAEQKFSLQQMNAVAQAGAFAITIEPKGGSASPTLENLVVIGQPAA